MQNMLQSAPTYGIITGTFAILISAVIVLVPSAAGWFDVHMAVLAPIVSCLCYGNSLEKVVGKSCRNAFSVIFGGLLSLVWVIILRVGSRGVSDTQDYNQYYAVALSFPWLLVFYLFSPKLVIEVHTLTLIFMTITMYSGDAGPPDASPLLAILSGLIGCFVSIVVSMLTCSIGRSKKLAQLASFSSAPFDFAILTYFDRLVDAYITGSSESLDSVRADCLVQIAKVDTIGIYGNVVVHMNKSFELLCAIHSLLRMHSAPIPGEICAQLVSLKSATNNLPSFLSSATDESLEQLSFQLVYSTPSLMLLPQLIKQFVLALNRYESSLHILMVQTEFTPKNLLNCLSRNRDRWSWIDGRRWADAFRFALVIVALSAILVLWDARDETVDTYALWSLLPALLLAGIITSIGQAIVDGARYLLSVFLGSGVGALCLLMNGSGRLGYIVEFALAIVVGLYGQEKIPNDCGIVFVVSWIVCVMGNMSLDPDETNTVDPEDASGLNLLWRIALYRMAITCFSVFIMALSFIIIPKPWASTLVDAKAKQCLQFGCSRIGELREEGVRKEKNIDKETEKKVQKNMSEWTVSEFPELSLFSSAERRRDVLLTESLFKNYVLSLAALAGFATAFGGLHVAAGDDLTADPSNLDSEIVALRASMELVMTEMARTQTTSHLSVARDLTSSLGRAKKYVALGRSSLLELRVVAAGTALAQFAKSWVKLEIALGIADTETPLVGSRSFGDLPCLIPHNEEV